MGVEPTSAQGNHMLSTRLFQPLIFVQQQDLDHQLMPYPLKSHAGTEAYLHYSRFASIAKTDRFGTTAVWAMSRSLALQGNKAKIYCSSIKQREHTYCCQLIFWKLCLRSEPTTLRVLTYHFISPSNPVSPVVLTRKYAKWLYLLFAKLHFFLELSEFRPFFLVISTHWPWKPCSYGLFSYFRGNETSRLMIFKTLFLSGRRFILSLQGSTDCFFIGWK